ncbi:hypothetical protein P170DRAFT_11721 [Aspergillus steynii IBT 23096]|uniref:Uncharacterized protein n=1 Tax=Aspergillus steynii IBT 23096 TaxID=1392250 RepID=A0A2I2GN32_9EURO|nr:uncharacterized protein P170DRAFT_11721 [Aspergillus steynii IBT 23096]PLB54260.1 hypothetical protein P170DRAFT_11721 [Aspergillus steynii IBT 23096]
MRPGSSSSRYWVLRIGRSPAKYGPKDKGEVTLGYYLLGAILRGGESVLSASALCYWLRSFPSLYYLSGFRRHWHLVPLGISSSAIPWSVFLFLLYCHYAMLLPTSDEFNHHGEFISRAGGGALALSGGTLARGATAASVIGTWKIRSARMIRAKSHVLRASDFPRTVFPMNEKYPAILPHPGPGQTGPGHRCVFR